MCKMCASAVLASRVKESAFGSIIVFVQCTTTEEPHGWCASQLSITVQRFHAITFIHWD